MKIINWNVGWSGKHTNRGSVMLEKIFNQNPEVVCITEGHQDFFETGYTITSEDNYGYKLIPKRRKVLLWSKKPWKNIESIGSKILPGGRFVSGITDTSLGEILFIGVCIPWDKAHVYSGKRNRKLWEDHKTYLDGLKDILLKDTKESTILFGDFNQRIPRAGQKREVYEKLFNAIPDIFSIATTGLIPGFEKQSIDHVYLTKNLSASTISAIDEQSKDSHCGVVLDVLKKR